VCGLSVLGDMLGENQNIRGKLASISPCNGTFINSTGADACPDGFAILESSSGLVKQAYEGFESPTATFYTCIPLGNDGFRFPDNTFIPNGKTASCTALASATLSLTTEARIEEGQMRITIEGRRTDNNKLWCKGGGGSSSTAICMPVSGYSQNRTEYYWYASPRANGTKDGLELKPHSALPPICTMEWR